MSVVVHLLVNFLVVLLWSATGVEYLRNAGWTETTPIVRVASLHHVTGRFAPYGVAYKAVFQMFQDAVVNTEGITTYSADAIDSYQVEFALIDIGANTWEQMKANVIKEAKNIQAGVYGNFSAILAPYSSELTPLVADLITDLPIFAPGAAADSVFICDQGLRWECGFSSGKRGWAWWRGPVEGVGRASGGSLF